ncbi:MAG: hypothetical protein J0L61_07355, partial [Planctomycetes bacterium]|nr:hypothetical protein [Planctomycetota bacterium]
ALADALVSDSAAPLSPAERALIVDALRELVISQSLIARQSMLLRSYGNDHAHLEATLRAAITMSIEAAARLSAASGFDAGAAERARLELTRQLDSAASVRDLVALALSFVGAIAA